MFLLNQFSQLHLHPNLVTKILIGCGIAITGYFASKIISKVTSRPFRSFSNAQSGNMVQKVVFYFIYSGILLTTLHFFGVDLKVLLGAAGVFTVAIGFAAQTSTSNLISGLFLMTEKPFSVGDTIRLGDLSGEVLSLDLFSTRLRTFDNLLVRIPNETLMKSQITNVTHFPIRRADLQLCISYKEDLDRVRKVLNALAEKNPECLDEPGPLFIIEHFGESGVHLQYSVWTQRQNYLHVKNQFQTEIIKKFSEEGIEIPYPQRVVHSRP